MRRANLLITTRPPNLTRPGQTASRKWGQIPNETVIAREPPFGAGFRQIVGRVRAAREGSFCARRMSCSPLGRGSGVIPADREEMPAQPISMTRCHVFSESWSLDAWSVSSQTCRDPTSPAGMTSGQAESAASGAPEPGNERRRGLACPTTRRRRQGGGLP